MIKVIVTGAAGRMGSRLISLVKDSAFLTLVGAVESKGHHVVGEDAGEVAGCGRTGVLIADNLSQLMERGEVVVDFTTPSATLDHLSIVAQHRRGIVVGTTGFSSAFQADTMRVFPQHERGCQRDLQSHCRNGQNPR
jgi:4-hydroxy-tetrahydrodipicolinate reductase